MKKFLESIYGTIQGHVDILTFDRETRSPDSERWISWPNEKGFGEKYLELREEDDVYVSVGVFSGERRTDLDMDAQAQVVWADADTCHPDNFREMPSIIVETSPGRWHVWWILDEPVKASEASYISRKISAAHADQGCDRGWHVSKILRVPGTTNTKYDEPFMVTAEYTNAVYSLDELSKAYADIDVESVVPQFSDKLPEPLHGEEIHKLENRLEELDLVDLYMTRPEQGQSWSERIYRLACELFRDDWTAQEVWSILLDAPINKYNTTDGVTSTGVALARRPHPELDLWRDVQKARLDAEEYTNEPSESLTEELPPVSFLTIPERQYIQDNPTFIEEYEAWALTRSPDSPPVYHRSLAWMILSASLADRVYTNAKWAKLFPQLWVFITGETTRHRKSTSMGFARDIIDAVDNALMEEPTYIGSDTTSEALLKALGARNGKSALVHTDEINGFFADVFTKGYRAGTLEMFTLLYDGKTPISLRSTAGAGNDRNVRATMSFLGGGIQSKLGQILTRDHLLSGFLLRVGWACADPIPYKPGQSDYQLPDEGQESVEYDPVRSGFIRQIARVKQQHDWESPSEVFPSHESVARLNKFVRELEEYAFKTGDEVVEAGVERIRDSVVKASVLLSTFKGEATISEQTMLRAILQGEEWFKSMLKMVSEISTSSFGREQDELVSYISSGSGRTRDEDAIYRKFSFRPGEFREIMDSLRFGGRVRKVTGDNKKRWQALV